MFNTELRRELNKLTTKVDNLENKLNFSVNTYKKFRIGDKVVYKDKALTQKEMVVTGCYIKYSSYYYKVTVVETGEVGESGEWNLEKL